MRSLSGGALAALQAASETEEVFLISLTYSSGTVYMNTGTRDLLWNGQTWDAVGGNLEIGPVEESGDMKGQGFDIQLSGVDQSIISILLGQDYRGRDVFIGQALLDQSAGTVIDVIEWADGLQLDNYEITEVAKRGAPLTCTVRTRIRHRLGEDEYRGIRASVSSHQKHFSDDTFFQHVPSLVGKKLYWGRLAPVTLGSGGGGGGPHEEYGDSERDE